MSKPGVFMGLGSRAVFERRPVGLAQEVLEIHADESESLAGTPTVTVELSRLEPGTRLVVVIDGTPVVVSEAGGFIRYSPRVADETQPVVAPDLPHLDPEPFVVYRNHHATAERAAEWRHEVEHVSGLVNYRPAEMAVDVITSFRPRPEYSQNREDYPA